MLSGCGETVYFGTVFQTAEACGIPAAKNENEKKGNEENDDMERLSQ